MTSSIINTPLKLAGWRRVTSTGVGVSMVFATSEEATESGEPGTRLQTVYVDADGEYWDNSIQPLHRAAVVLASSARRQLSGEPPDNHWRDVTNDARERFIVEVCGAPPHPDGSPEGFATRPAPKRRRAPNLRYEPKEPLQVIGLIGGIGEGKSTAAEHLSKEFGYREVTFADKLKDVVRDVFGLPPAAVFGTQADKALKRRELNWSSARRALEVIGTDGFREISPTVWVNYVARRAKDSGGRIVVSDVRFPNEAEWIKSVGGVIVRVFRQHYDPPRTGHASDLHWPTMPYDFLASASDVPGLHAEINAIASGLQRQ